MRNAGDPFPGARSVQGALLRAAVAGVLIAVLLFFVGEGKEAGEEATSSSIATPAPATATATPSLDLQPPLAERSELPVEPLGLPPPESVPAPQAVQHAQALVEAEEPAPVVPELSADATRKAEEPAPPPPPGRVSAPAAGSAPYLVRLAGFGSVASARNLLDAATIAGHPGRILHRVLVGPFASRAAAQQVLSGGTSGILVEDDGRWWVQSGVFSEGANAERQRVTLAGAGNQVVVQGLAEVGPFTSKTAADKALADLRAALGQPLRDADVVRR